MSSVLAIFAALLSRAVNAALPRSARRDVFEQQGSLLALHCLIPGKVEQRFSDELMLDVLSSEEGWYGIIEEWLCEHREKRAGPMTRILRAPHMTAHWDEYLAEYRSRQSGRSTFSAANITTGTLSAGCITAATIDASRIGICPKTGVFILL